MDHTTETGAAGKLEDLMRKIPGFGGYLDRERRRDADKLQRDFMAKGLSELKRKVQDAQEQLLEGGQMKLMTKLDDVNNIVDRVAGRLRSASYGYSGFFDQNQVNEEELNRIYEFDLSLVNELQHADEALLGLTSSLEGDNVKARISDLEKAIRAVDSKLDERERLLKGVR
ncbi:hypothetical protein IV102_30675 [bacterium]|nr:hypothetical protein [bacterium]